MTYVAPILEGVLVLLRGAPSPSFAGEPAAVIAELRALVVQFDEPIDATLNGTAGA